MRLLLVFLLVVACSLSSVESFAGVVAPPERPALYAGFDYKMPGEPIGTRGGVFGEPKTLGGLAAVVVETTPGQNVLRVSNDLSSTAARRLRWQPMGDVEIGEGEVKISFNLTTTALDKYSVTVRESTTSAKTFLTLNLSASGALTAQDINGDFLSVPNAYSANVPLHVSVLFDMDARTSSIFLNGAQVSAAHALGIADRGIGSVSIGYLSGSGGHAFDLDNLTISGALPFPIALDADFDDKAAGLPIGLGGAELNEPYSRGGSMNAVVFDPVPGVRILDMASTNTATAQTLRWQFLDNLEVRSGLLVTDFDLLLSDRDLYRISLREPSSSSQGFMNLQFHATGAISISDSTGTSFLTASYNAGQMYQYRIIHNLDAGTYDIFRDGLPLLREREHGITTRGIGGILNTISNGALTSSHMQIDSLRVYASNAAAISSELEFLHESSSAVQNQPVTPAIEVGVMNILDQAVPDGTPVALEIAQGSGPSGAALGGATTTTVAGIAHFATLTFDMPGSYRLLARSLDAKVLGSVDVVVEPSDRIFANGFD